MQLNSVFAKSSLKNGPLFLLGCFFLLACGEGGGGSSSSGAATPPVSITLSSPAIGITFTDTNAGFLSGQVSITRATDETDITKYALYWRNATLEKQDSTPIVTLDKTGTDLNYTFPASIAVPLNATHFLVYSLNNDGEMASGINLPILELGTPLDSAAAIAFTDTDLDAGQLAGLIQITKAANEAGLTHYAIYWGAGPLTKESTTPIATLAKTGANVSYNLPVNNIPLQA